MSFHDELDLIIEALDNVGHAQSDEKVALTREIRDRAEQLRALDEDDLAELVEQAQLMLANLTTQ